MSNAFELAVMFGAIVLALYLAFDWIRASMRHRREHAHIDRLAGDQPEEPVVAEESVLAKRLKAAGAVGPPEAYVLGAGVLAVVVSVLMLRLFPSFPLGALIGLALTLYLSWTAMNELGKRRARRFEQRLIGAIDLMTGALYAGGNLTQALCGVASASEAPVGREFDEAARRLALGMSIERAFGRMAERYRGEGVSIFAHTLAAKYQAGGDLAPTLKSLNETLRDRWRQQREVRSQLGGARITAIAGVLLPYGLAALLAWQQPHWFDGLTTHPLGRPLMFLAVMFQLIGVLWIWHILNREL